MKSRIILFFILLISNLYAQENTNSPVELYQYFRRYNGNNFYTPHFKELGSGNSNYEYKKVCCYVFNNLNNSDLQAIHRYYSRSNDRHFYTNAFSELGSGRDGWNYEGIGFYVFKTQEYNSIPLYRYNNTKTGSHYYTINFSEYGKDDPTYRYEGVLGYVFGDKDSYNNINNPNSGMLPKITLLDEYDFVDKYRVNLSGNCNNSELNLIKSNDRNYNLFEIDKSKFILLDILNQKFTDINIDSDILFKYSFIKDSQIFFKVNDEKNYVVYNIQTKYTKKDKCKKLDIWCDKLYNSSFTIISNNSLKLNRTFGVKYNKTTCAIELLKINENNVEYNEVIKANSNEKLLEYLEKYPNSDKRMELSEIILSNIKNLDDCIKYRLKIPLVNNEVNDLAFEYAKNGSISVKENYVTNFKENKTNLLKIRQEIDLHYKNIEKKRKAEELKKQEEETRRINEELGKAVEADKYRKERIAKLNSISEGDLICFSEDWIYKDNFFGFSYNRTTYKMKAIMLVEKVLANGKVKLIVNNIESSDNRYYSSISVGNLTVKEGQTIYFSKDDMIKNSGFQYCQ